jgi:hypothetical protein
MDEDLEPNEWLAQKTPFLNATSFAAAGFTSSSILTGMSFYALNCLREALQDQQDTQEWLRDSLIQVPAASIWVTIAGPKIYGLCKSEAEGFSIERWASWKAGFARIVGNHQAEAGVRDNAQQGLTHMEKIENEH